MGSKVVHLIGQSFIKPNQAGVPLSTNEKRRFNVVIK